MKKKAILAIGIVAMFLLMSTTVSAVDPDDIEIKVEGIFRGGLIKAIANQGFSFYINNHADEVVSAWLTIKVDGLVEFEEADEFNKKPIEIGKFYGVGDLSLFGFGPCNIQVDIWCIEEGFTKSLIANGFAIGPYVFVIFQSQN